MLQEKYRGRGLYCAMPVAAGQIREADVLNVDRGNANLHHQIQSDSDANGDHLKECVTCAALAKTSFTLVGSELDRVWETSA